MPPLVWLIAYNLLQVIGSLALAIWLLYRKIFQKKGEGWSERLGASPLTSDDAPRPIWIHAVSAGEVAAAAPIIHVLIERFPGVPIVLSTLTPAGREMAGRLCPKAKAFYFPWDLWIVVRRCIRRTRPRAVMLMEAEFWPNFLSRCQFEKIPVIVVNGRISDRGYRRARRIRGAMKWAYGMVSAFGMQSKLDATRALALGAPADRLKTLGQTKFDQESGPLSPDEALRLREELSIPRDAPVLIGGSTRPGEEDALLDALAALRGRFPDLKLILAPRHLERAEEAEHLTRSRHFKPAYRSSPTPDADVLILNTMGELGRIYAAADVCFVGGTLANIGGHNLLQPLAQGKPVIYGPHTQNVRDIADLVFNAGVGFPVNDAAGLIEKVADALSHPEEWAELGRRALEVVETNKGASKRYADLLESILDEGSARDSILG